MIVSLGAQSASASTASLTGGSLNYTAASGEANQLRVTVTDGTADLPLAILTDSVTITPGAGCTRGDEPANLRRVACQVQAPAPRAMSLRLTLGDGNDVLLAQSGATLIPSYTVIDGAGNDRVTIGPESTRNTFVNGAGNDWLTAQDGPTSVLGGPGNDTIRGSSPAVLGGGPGADRIYGGVGSDRLYGGFGNDRLFGGRGFDRLFGGPGFDLLDGRVRDVRFG